jgi:hypothetical protein
MSQFGTKVLLCFESAKGNEKKLLTLQAKL